MRILGLDPGTATTGYGILENSNQGLQILDYGCIRTETGEKIENRLQQIAEDLEFLLKKWQPQSASIEKIFFNKNVKTGISVAQARGVILQKLVEHGLQIREFSPHQIKSTVCGYGKADKKAVQTMVAKTLGLKQIPQPDDAADAIAIALCAINTKDFL